MVSTVVTAALVLAWLLTSSGSGATPARSCGTHGAGVSNGSWRDALAATARLAHTGQVVLGHLAVRGSLDREIVRRIIVRWHLDEVKGCYEKELTKLPDLEGRVTVQFTVSVTGAVSSSDLGSSTLGSARVEKCVVNAVRGWEFPRTMGGGTTLVTAAFDFSPAPDGKRVPTIVDTAPSFEAP